MALWNRHSRTHLPWPDTGEMEFCSAVRSVFSDQKKLSMAALSRRCRSTLAANDAAVGHQLVELFAGVLAALVRVMQQASGLPRRQNASRASATNRAFMHPPIDSRPPGARKNDRGQPVQM